ncbi:MFS transporter, PPP family, 3-phenylpropionic acid transporter [Ardenticatena maritima]|uniref:MFS transporter, PPP family, 3-phenylpropionic acid transporter n=1 Tax=Ardenticatena maritima TaxID=872965 RepID=A0A0M9UCG4_9CHLR|nr:MFS transporter [Ardenticatena maritima]KPL86373.1 hypothetical protein SE16_13730 [Ardenticatena maritima]GAP62830.1 MFS transporter, PPP family, 3-phenylpropionic acid transporter [Ardenticatena maritima]
MSNPSLTLSTTCQCEPATPPARLWSLGAAYFFYFMALGAIFPFLPLYYARLGLNDEQIGLLAAVVTAVSVPMSLVWGTLADNVSSERRLLQAILLGVALALFALSRVDSFALVFVVVIVYGALNSATVPLLDGLTIESVRAYGRSSFGEIRVWGSIGWTLATLLTGKILEWTFFEMFFWLGIGLLVMTFFTTPFHPERGQRAKASLREGVRDVLKPPFTFMLAALLLLGIAMSAANNFYSLFLNRMGASETLVGVAWAIGSLSEIPVVFYASRLTQRFGSARILQVAFLVFALRWFLYVVSPSPGWAVAVQVLHGLSFGTFLVGSMGLLAELIPSERRATAQFLFMGTVYGLGSLFGATSGGMFVERFGVRALYMVTPLLALAGWGVFVATVQRRLQQKTV